MYIIDFIIHTFLRWDIKRNAIGGTKEQILTYIWKSYTKGEPSYLARLVHWQLVSENCQTQITWVLSITLHTKKKFSIKDFFSKCDQIYSFLRIWSHLLKKFLIENFIFCGALFSSLNSYFVLDSLRTSSFSSSGIYLLKVNKETLEQGVKYVQS